MVAQGSRNLRDRRFSALRKMIEWKAFEHESGTYDLSHVHPYVATFEQPAKGSHPARQYVVNVAFSHHCFTRGLKETDDPNGALVYPHAKEQRVFDFERYEKSKQLRAIIAELPVSHCFHTDRGNFFSVRLLNSSTGEEESYEVYFKAFKSRSELTLVVQSAYVRDREHPGRPRKKKIGFLVVLYNTLKDKPIKPPPK